MPTVEGPTGPLEVLVTGRGDPVTVFAHGLAGSIAETRPFGSGVVGTRVFLHFRGHGASAGGETPWTYSAVAAELMAVVDRYEARRGLGVSLGAGALLAAAVDEPERFERLVFVLPATIDQPRRDPAIQRMQRMAELIQQRDLDGLADALVAEQPAAARERPDVRLWAARQARRLAATVVARGLRELPPQFPVADRSLLRRVACPVLVVGQEGDDAHPAEVARELAELLPEARLEVFDEAGLVWAHRAELRGLVSGFLNG